MLEKFIDLLKKFDKKLEEIEKKVAIITETIVEPLEVFVPIFLILLVISKNWRLLEVFFIVFVLLELVDMKEKINEIHKDMKLK